MPWFSALIPRKWRDREAATADLPPGAGEAELLMEYALTYALELRSERLGFGEHCARVAGLCEKLAVELDIPEAARSDLVAAARLHEIGMIAVPESLARADAPLSREQSERLRAQAWIGAEIARTTQTARTAWLIERQYADFAALRDEAAPGSSDLLLAGILRAADVYDTFGDTPAPRSVDGTRILRKGAGTTFHPRVVELLLDEPSPATAGASSSPLS